MRSEQSRRVHRRAILHGQRAANAPPVVVAASQVDRARAFCGHRVCIERKRDGVPYSSRTRRAVRRLVL